MTITHRGRVYIVTTKHDIWALLAALGKRLDFPGSEPASVAAAKQAAEDERRVSGLQVGADGRIHHDARQATA